MRMILIGPPGVGKGTQGESLEKKLQILKISTGDMFRQNIRDHTKLGQVAVNFMNEGKLVPDTVVLEMVKNRIQNSDCDKGYILDGFPRTIPQAEGLDAILKQLTQELNAVLVIQADQDEIVKRLSSRRSCRRCLSVYNLISDPPEQKNKCNKCGNELYLRDDDQSNTIRKRLGIYKQKTEPLIHFYSQNNLVKKINGIGTIEEVKKRIFNLLKIND